jgi:AraC-like DNA-binding protein
MKLEFIDIKQDGIFRLSDYTCPVEQEKMNAENIFRIAWVKEGVAEFLVDQLPVSVPANHMVFFTPHNQVEVVSGTHKLIALSFNREFYCIRDHDHEVSCHGFLFYGSSEVPVVELTMEEAESFDRLYKVFLEEFEYKDNIQGEMLRMLLKRLLIKSSRLNQKLLVNPEMPNNQLDVIRKFNVLVEMHFREKHKVKDYADLLFKSPKTLSNLFAQYNNETPLQVINQRILLEAKRLLFSTSKTIEEIAYELGYSDAPHFSKFFKKHVGLSPVAYKKETVSA